MKLLSAILLTPLAGAVVTACVPAHRTRIIRSVAAATAVLGCVLCWSVPFLFNTLSSDLQLSERHVWNPAMGSFYALGVDGFSLPMVLLSSVLTVVAVLASASMERNVKGYHVWLLALEFGMLGVFLAQDWALFYVFWELTLIALFLLIDLWGGVHRHRASLNFVLYAMGGSVFMLVALLAIYEASPAHSTAMDSMQAVARGLPGHTQTLIFLGLLFGFGVKTPIVPLHGWLPLVHVEAPGPIGILLSGALLKMGAYGLIRTVEMMPDAAITLQPLLAGLAFFGIIYGALLAWRQADLKAMLAYSSISHMGIVLLGIATLNVTGLFGAMLQMSAHGLVSGSLFLLIGLLYERTGTLEIADYGSLHNVTPRFAALTTVTLLAVIGLPGSMGFVAELHTLIGGFERFGWWTLLLGFGILIGAAYGFRVIGSLFSGPVRPAMQGLKDLQPAEFFAAGLLMAGIAGFGVAPALPLAVVNASIARLTAAF